MPHSVFRRLARRMAGWVFGLGGAALFFYGTAAMAGGALLALPPVLAVCAGALSFTAWFVLHLSAPDAVKARPRRRR
ncbi:hypothetical protein JOF48_003271 [Arthrobacter stackebrandtii]|uniref:DUF4175 domain-containing protein n=1 Tax=Arthrobacter stackebrandtii TaxID=272161 RepID=A0ABS4Z089_9MICC|nr:hypothetical protein [Arthrobacter stackebrandtii]MBP2414472.1 hypothetical protein [Arthrobacter stackebrandtii]PYH01598.1 hypothetical protein CVV67_03755 [Arthrobacter stackebrandtii]